MTIAAWGGRPATPRPAAAPRRSPSPGGCRSGGLRIDVGCGAGRYLPHLGTPAIAFDASAVMLDACRREVPGGLPVLGDVEHLPFARRIDRRRLVVDDPSPRPPGAAAHGPVGPAAGAGGGRPLRAPGPRRGVRRGCPARGRRRRPVLRRLATRPAGRGGDRGRVRRRRGLIDRVRRRGAAPGDPGPDPGRYRRPGDAAPDLWGQPVDLLGRRRRRLRPTR